MNPNTPKTNRFQILLIGNSKSGKTTIITTLNGESKKVIPPTVGADYKVKYYVISEEKAKESIAVKILDSSGQEMFLSIVRNTIKNCQGIMVIYDVTNRSYFEGLEKWFEIIKSSFTKQIPIILVGNKSDLLNERTVSTLEGQQMANKYCVPFFEVSAFNQVQVEEIFSSFTIKF